GQCRSRAFFPGRAAQIFPRAFCFASTLRTLSTRRASSDSSLASLRILVAETGSFVQERCQPSVCGFFVAMHKPRITSHVGGQYRRQLALDRDWPLLRHGPQPLLRDILYDESNDRANGF